MTHAAAGPVNKVFIGCTDIASLIHDFTAGFAAHDVAVLSMVHQRARIQGGRCDYEIAALVPPPDAGAGAAAREAWAARRAQAVQRVWQRAVRECDTFLFLWDSFRPDYRDLAELRRLGKRVVWWFCGDDSRWKPAYDQDVARYGLPPLHYGDPHDRTLLLERTLRLRTAEALATAVVNTPSQCALALRPYFDALHSPMALDRFPHAPGQREVPVLLHAPSRAEKKGTAEILGVLETLRAEGLSFTLRTLEQVPHAEAIDAYRDVDVLVGQLGALTLGRQDRELMACGKVVVGGPTADRYPQAWPADCPAVPALTAAQLAEALRALIPDVARRRAIAARGRDFVARHHDPARTVGRLLEALQGTRAPDFVPTFFRDTFTPESSEALPVHNLGLDLVRESTWYARHVRPGERDGLRF